MLGLLCIGGCFLVGAIGIGAISDSMEEAQARQKEAVKDLEVVNFQWNKEGTGSAMKANFVIKNNGAVNVKDIKINFVQYAPSGTKLGNQDKTFYEVIKAGVKAASLRALIWALYMSKLKNLRLQLYQRLL